MIIIVLFLLVPLLLGLIVQYAVCRLCKRLPVRLLPPVLAAGATALIAHGRIKVWSSLETSPVTQLLLFPGLAALFLFIGLWLGWRIWQRRWQPRVIRDKKKG